jgi:hypothetical protein
MGMREKAAARAENEERQAEDGRKAFSFSFSLMVEKERQTTGNDEGERFLLIGSASLIEFLGLQSAFVVSYAPIAPRAMFTPSDKVYKTHFHSVFVVVGFRLADWTRQPPAGNVPDDSR